jgi:hypothetical protein
VYVCMWGAVGFSKVHAADRKHAVSDELLPEKRPHPY